MTQPEVREIVAGALARQVGSEVPILDATPLFEGGLCLDSIQLLETILAIEKETGVVLRGEELTAEVLATVGSAVEHVLGRCRE